MHKVTKIMTNDGHMFDTVKDAKHYLEVKYADCLCKLASKLVTIDKYQKMCEFLDTHINEDLFVQVQEIKREIAPQINKEEQL